MEIETLIEKWEVRAAAALPADAMLINKHLRELREAHNELRRDAERLDWLQRVSKTSTVYMNNQHPWNMTANPKLRDLHGPTLRAAIDAAMNGANS